MAYLYIETTGMIFDLKNRKFLFYSCSLRPIIKIQSFKYIHWPVKKIISSSKMR